MKKSKIQMYEKNQAYKCMKKTVIQMYEKKAYRYEKQAYKCMKKRHRNL